MGQYVKIYKGETPPINSGVIWQHHSVTGDSTSPIVTQIYDGSDWIDVGQQSSGNDDQEELTTHVLEILDFEEDGQDVDDVLGNLELDGETPTLQQLRDIDITSTCLKYSDTVLAITQKTVSTNLVKIQSAYHDFGDKAINGYIITVDENYVPAIYTITNENSIHGIEEKTGQ